MQLPIYYTFEEFQENFEKDFEKFCEIFKDSNKADFVNELIMHYNFAIDNVTIINPDEIGLKTDRLFITQAELRGNTHDEIQKKINAPEVEYWKYLEAKNLRFTFERIIEFLNKHPHAGSSSPLNKINSKLTNLQGIGFLFSEMIDKGLIEPKRKNGKTSPLNVARMILDHFHFEDLEIQPKEEDLRKALFEDNKLSEDKRNIFKLPTKKQINEK